MEGEMVFLAYGEASSGGGAAGASPAGPIYRLAWQRRRDKRSPDRWRYFAAMHMLGWLRRFGTVWRTLGLIWKLEVWPWQATVGGARRDAWPWRQ